MSNLGVDVTPRLATTQYYLGEPNFVRRTWSQFTLEQVLAELAKTYLVFARESKKGDGKHWNYEVYGENNELIMRATYQPLAPNVMIKVDPHRWEVHYDCAIFSA